MNISTRGVKVCQRALSSDRFQAALRAAILAAAQELRNEMVRYPPAPSGPLAWSSERQRKFYLAARRAAGLSPKYVRIIDPWSQKLRHSWVAEVRKGPAGPRGIAYTDVSYALFVQKSGAQTPMHRRTGWKTEKEVLNEFLRRGRLKMLIEKACKSGGG